MHGPDGVDYINKTVYLEVEDKAKLVYDHGGNDEQKPLFRVTVKFSESKGKTTMDMVMALPTPEEAETTKKFVKKAGGNATWDRLAEFLDKKVSNKDGFVINRTFEAPIDVMFDMWTNPEHVSKWLPPTGFDMQYLKADIKSGGKSFYMMSNKDGMKMYGRAEYLEIQKPNLIIYTQQFCDENENVSRHPMAPTWPATMITRIDFTEEGQDETRVTVTMAVHGDATQDELDTFLNARGGMTQGWTGSFDKLDEYLEKR